MPSKTRLSGYPPNVRDGIKQYTASGFLGSLNLNDTLQVWTPGPRYIAQRCAKQLTECRTRKFSPNLDRPLVWAGVIEMELPVLWTHVFPIFAPSSLIQPFHFPPFPHLSSTYIDAHINVYDYGFSLTATVAGFLRTPIHWTLRSPLASRSCERGMQRGHLRLSLLVCRSFCNCGHSRRVWLRTTHWLHSSLSTPLCIDQPHYTTTSNCRRCSNV